jgi:hypothetical protein
MLRDLWKPISLKAICRVERMDWPACRVDPLLSLVETPLRLRPLLALVTPVRLLLVLVPPGRPLRVLVPPVRLLRVLVPPVRLLRVLVPPVRLLLVLFPPVRLLLVLVPPVCLLLVLVPPVRLSLVEVKLLSPALALPLRHPSESLLLLVLSPVQAVLPLTGI